MGFIKRVARNYWVVYYVVYVGGVAGGLGRYWQRLAADDGILWLAAIFGAAAGSALLVAIFLEVLGRMVLLIPAAIEKLKEAGRKEGREAGREEGREAGREEGRMEARRQERRRVAEVLRQHGTREDGSAQITLPLTPEVLKLLTGESDDNL